MNIRSSYRDERGRGFSISISQLNACFDKWYVCKDGMSHDRVLCHLRQFERHRSPEGVQTIKLCFCHRSPGGGCS